MSEKQTSLSLNKSTFCISWEQDVYANILRKADCSLMTTTWYNHMENTLLSKDHEIILSITNLAY